MNQPPKQTLIDPVVFKHEFLLWLDWTGEKLSQETTIERYYLELSAKLSTDEFLEASKLLFTKKKTLPTVEELVTAIEGDIQLLARLDWLKIERNLSSPIEIDRGLSEKGKLALSVIGGMAALNILSAEILQQKRQEFLSIYICFGNVVSGEKFLSMQRQKQQSHAPVKQLELEFQPV